MGDHVKSPVIGDVLAAAAVLRAEAANGKNREDLRSLMDETAELLQQLLQRQAPQPVPVSERLPGPENLDECGRCWLFDPCDYDWCFTEARFFDEIPLFYSHWLPAHALPLPEVTE